MVLSLSLSQDWLLFFSYFCLSLGFRNPLVLVLLAMRWPAKEAARLRRSLGNGRESKRVYAIVLISVSKLVLFHFEFWSQFIWAFGEPLTRSSGGIIIRLGGACAIVGRILTLQWVSTPSEHNSEQWICRAMENGRETNFASLRLKFSRLSASEFQFRPNKRPSESERANKQTYKGKNNCEGTN